MERIDLANWLTQHPEAIHADPNDLLEQMETKVRDRAHRDAWIHARDIAEQSMHRFERIFGNPASDTFVTQEVCHEIARELKHHEPHPDDEDADEWAGQAALDALEPEARLMLHHWLKELAEKEEHTAWLEIVHFTHHLARNLIRDGHMTSECDWDLDHTYPKIAARVTRMLIREFETHATSDAQIPITAKKTH
ncbi:MAG: hypothetical protein JRJ58_10025 [Deltaproteobacteria bacterium]|nr:hypothetical protein [Deltaproteobacteria bacterium]